MIDDPTFEKYYKDNYYYVLSFFLRLGFNRDEARDLTQDVFLRVYEKRASFREEAHFRTWMKTVMNTVWKNHLRSIDAKKRSGVNISMDDGQGEPESLDQSAEERLTHQERVRLFKDAVAKLPKGMQRCMVLRFLHGLKYREIAALLKLSLDTVKVQIHQGRARLEETLGQDDLEHIPRGK